MAGRRPKPTTLHKLQGTYNATKHGRDRAQEPIIVGSDLTDVEPPVDLTDTQSEIWREALAAAPRDVLKTIDKKVFSVFVEAADRHNTARVCQALLDNEPQLKLLVKGPLGNLIASPYNAILDKTGDTILRCSDKLGFNPTIRPRIKVDKSDQTADTTNPWTQLRLVPGGKS